MTRRATGENCPTCGYYNHDPQWCVDLIAAGWRVAAGAWWSHPDEPGGEHSWSVADAMRVERWRRAMGAPGQVQATIASAAAKVHAAVTKRREAAKIRHGDNLYKRADEEHKDALCFYFGVVEASFGRPATTTPTPVDVAAPPEPFVPTSTTCYRCNGTIWSVPCPDGKPGCEVFHHEHVCPRDEGSSNPALPPRHT